MPDLQSLLLEPSIGLFQVLTGAYEFPLICSSAAMSLDQKFHKSLAVLNWNPYYCLVSRLRFPPRGESNMSTFVHIIDDHEDSVETMTILLQSEGFKVMAHSSFSKALAELNHAPCIVFADYRVPDKIAFSEFVDECRRLHPDTTIVMTTGDSRARQEAEALGVDFMLKPIDVDDIVAAAKRLCPSRSS